MESHQLCLRPWERILFAALALFFTVWIAPANAASEPGAVTIVLTAEPQTLDPGNTIRAIEGQVMLRNILEPLTEFNLADSTVVPRLATSWKQIDPYTWHFLLRKGVTFHDGADFDAEAVVYNIKRLYDKRKRSATYDKFFADFTLSGKAIDSHTVELKTDKVQALMPTLMATLAMCSPNTPMDKWTRQPIGTGPYKLVTWDAGMQIVVDRFDGYWGRQPQVKKSIYIWRNESAVRAKMVEIGEADLAPEIAQQDATNPNTDYSYLNSATTSLKIGGEWDPPFSDRRFRMALNYAVDRDAIRGSILSKDVIPATQTFVPSTFGYNPDLKVWPYDPQKARQLLAEARKDGVPVDKELLIVGRIGYFPGSDELNEALMTMFKAVGFNVKVKTLESAQERIYGNRPYPPGLYFRMSNHDNAVGDAAFSAQFKYHCKGVQSSMCDKTVDDLIEKAQLAVGEERRNLWRAAFKRISEEIVPEVMLFHMVGYCRVGKRINFKPSMATMGEIQLAQITFK